MIFLDLKVLATFVASIAVVFVICSFHILAINIFSTNNLPKTKFCLNTVLSPENPSKFHQNYDFINYLVSFFMCIAVD